MTSYRAGLSIEVWLRSLLRRKGNPRLEEFAMIPSLLGAGDSVCYRVYGDSNEQ